MLVRLQRTVQKDAHLPLVFRFTHGPGHRTGSQSLPSKSQLLGSPINHKLSPLLTIFVSLMFLDLQIQIPFLSRILELRNTRYGTETHPPTSPAGIWVWLAPHLSCFEYSVHILCTRVLVPTGQTLNVDLQGEWTAARLLPKWQCHMQLWSVFEASHLPTFSSALAAASKWVQGSLLRILWKDTSLFMKLPAF